MLYSSRSRFRLLALTAVIVLSTSCDRAIPKVAEQVGRVVALPAVAFVSFAQGDVKGKALSDQAGAASANTMGAVLTYLTGTAGQLRNSAVTNAVTMPSSPAPQTITWNAPDQQSSGTVKAGEPRIIDTRECREVDEEIVVRGQVMTARGLACRQADGSWRVE